MLHFSFHNLFLTVMCVYACVDSCTSRMRAVERRHWEWIIINANKKRNETKMEDIFPSDIFYICLCYDKWINSSRERLFALKFSWILLHFYFFLILLIYENSLKRRWNAMDGMQCVRQMFLDDVCYRYRMSDDKNTSKNKGAVRIESSVISHPWCHCR